MLLVSSKAVFALKATLQLEQGVKLVSRRLAF